MAGPLNGVGVNQQIPVANAFQQGQNGSNVGIRENDDVRAQQDVVQPEGAEVAEALTTGADDQETAVDQRNATNALEQLSGNEERGSLVDVLV